MQMIELFSGCGGLAKGMENAGFRHLAFIEINRFACETLRRNFDPGIVHEMDVRDFDFSSMGEVDLIAGGPPCQPFSLGGLAKAHDDHRDLFPQAIRAIGELAPKGFVFENVKGLLRKSFADYFDYVVLRLTFPDFALRKNESWRDHLERLRSVSYPRYAGLKYRVQHKLVNAADYGVPQIRERVFIIGVRSDIKEEWSWPAPTVNKKSWRTIQDALCRVPDPQTPHGLKDHVFVGGARAYPGHTGSEVDKPSKTLKAGAHGVPGGENMIRFKDESLRYMTVYEAKLIQSFPASYAISGTWGEAMRQIGNAVPVKLAEVMGRSMFRLLSAHDRSKDTDEHLNPTQPYRTGTDGNLLLFESTKKYSVKQRAVQRGCGSRKR
jgi:DNA (cytosine-5)-methyltransferase 1